MPSTFKKVIVKQVANDDLNNSALNESNDISMDQSSIMNVSQNTQSYPKIYKKNIELDPRYDLCQEKFKYKFFEKGKNNSPECNICKVSFSANDQCRRIVACQHIFHEECIKKYLKENDMRCPTCFKIIDFSAVTSQQAHFGIGGDGDEYQDRKDTQEDICT